MLKKTTLARTRGLSIIALCTATLLLFSSADFPSNKVHSFVAQKVRQLEKVIHKELRTITSNDSMTASNMWMMDCTPTSGEISGSVFNDFNKNGLDDQFGNIPDVQVILSSCDADGNTVQVATTQTDSDGAYQFTGLTDGMSFRLEFVLPTDLSFMTPGFGGDNGTAVQFVTAPACEVKAAFSHPAEYCEEDPLLIMPCYINGDPNSNSSAGLDAMIAIRKSEERSATSSKLTLATASEIGSVYGVAYEKNNQIIYTSSFIKRHTGLGSLGVGGIYAIDISNPNNPFTSDFLDVAALGIDFGTLPSNADRGLGEAVDPTNDADAFDAVGKIGIGDMDISEDGSTLWLVNLFAGSVMSVVIDSDANPDTAPTLSDVSAFSLPNVGCVNGQFRPFAIEYHHGSVYVGGVCDAEGSNNSDDLEAIVLKLENGVFSEILRYDLDYPRGSATRDHECDNETGWFAWTSTMPADCGGTTDLRYIVHPTPILSDLEIAEDGAILMGFMDRMGHQIGFNNYGLSGNTPLVTTVSGGDILIAHPTDAGYVLENNASSGGNTTAGAGTNHGPGGGEFFFQDAYINVADITAHGETSQGALAIIPGSDTIISNALDPFGTRLSSGGVNYFSKTTGGARDPGTYVYITSTSNISTFQKANGIGDLEVACEQAPLELGTYVWLDNNSNGIQDACEPALENVNVTLYREDGTAIVTLQTDAHGVVYFNDNTIGEELTTNTTYYIAAGTSGQYADNSLSVDNQNYYLTMSDAATGTNADAIDSDGSITGGVGAVTGFPFAEVRTGGTGDVNHTIDFGFSPDNPNPTGTLTGIAWLDADEDGILDNTESRIGNVTVTLYNADGTVVGTTTTDDTGNYSFNDIPPGDYYVIFDETTNDDNLTNLASTLQDQGNDDNLDSEINSVGRTTTFTFDPDNTTDVNAGYFVDAGSLTGIVWLDADEDGILDNTESRISDVTVRLYDSNDVLVGTTTTDDTGRYIFMNTPPGDYYVIFDETTNDDNLDNLTVTLQNQGNDDNLDSEINGISRTNTFTFDPDNTTDVNAGYYIEVTLNNIGDFIFIDYNADGIQDAGEPGIADISVQLTGTSITGDAIDQTTQTDITGNYLFTNIPDGTYTITFVLPNNKGELSFSPAGRGGNADLDSDAAANGQTSSFVVAGTNRLDIDAGIQDNSAPTFQGTPSDETVNCQDPQVSNPPTVTAIDNLEGAINVTFEEEPFDDGTGCNMGLRRTWTAIDGSGNVQAFTQTITIVDDTPPQIIGGDNPLSVGCDEQPMVSFLDDCDVSPSLTFTDEILSTAPRVVNRTWRVTDNCGNEATKVQQITFSGSSELEVMFTHPDLIGKVDGDTVLLGCLVDGLPYSADDALAVDNCGDGGFIRYIDHIDRGICNIDGYKWRIECIWRAVANDLSDSTEIRLLMIANDREAPVLLGVPADMTIGCDEAIPTPPTVTATDNCDTEVVVELTAENQCENGRMIRTWTATDSCGNTSVGQQIINFNSIPLEFLTTLEDVTVDCGNIPVAVEPPVTTNCFNVRIDFTERIFGDTCADYKIFREWRAENDCGEIASVSHTINVIVPTLESIMPPADITVNCPEEVPYPPFDPSVMMSCLEVEVAYTQDSIPSACPNEYILVRQWAVTNSCGELQTATRTIKVVDDIPPEVKFVHPDLVGAQDGDTLFIQCEIGDLPYQPDDAMVVDECSNSFIRYIDEIEQGTCPEDGYKWKITCTWRAVKECLTDSSGITLYMMVVDEVPPTLIGVPNDMTVDCPEDIPPMNVTATDNCDDEVVVVLDSTIVGNVCEEYELIKTWTATDECGNSTSMTRTVTVMGSTLEFVNPPQNRTVTCDNIPDPDMPQVSSMCYNPEIEFEEFIFGDTCRTYKIFRKWTATNDCEQMAMTSHTITVEIPPLTATVPDDMMLDCTGLPVPEPVTPTITNGCTDITMEYRQDSIPGSCSYNYTLRRTWTISNECGETVTATRDIVVADNTAPEITVKHPILDSKPGGVVLEVECDNIPLFTPEDAMAMDNCDDNPTIEFFEVIENGDCPTDGYLTRMVCGWIATDACGNTSEYSFTMIVHDTQAPVLENVPSDRTINLWNDETVPSIPDVTVSDNCDSNIFIDFTQRSEAIDNCGYIITRTWKAEDDCGNSTERTQIITVNDICDCPDINGVTVDVKNPECESGELGSVEIMTNGTPDAYNYTLVRANTTEQLESNVINDLPEGSYLVIISLPNVEDCIEKYYFDIEEFCPPEPDTIDVTIADKLTTICLDDYNVFESSGQLVSTSICDAGSSASVAAVSLDGYCVDLEPGVDFSGNAPVLICITHCFDDNTCDNTYLRVSVERIINPCSLAIDNVATTDPSCDGNDGTIELTVSGFSNAVTYQWQPNVSASNTANNLGAGSYSITVTDPTTNCTVTQTVTLDAPAGGGEPIDESDLIVEGATCDDGGFIVAISNTTYTISQNGATIGTTPINDLAAGVYTVSTMGGCSSSVMVTIDPAPELTYDITTTPETCAENDGTITLAVSGGSRTYTYEWSPNVSTSNTATGLSNNQTYSITITEESGCTLFVENVSVGSNCEDNNGGGGEPTCALTAGSISTTAPTTICTDDGSADNTTITLVGASPNTRLILTSVDGNIQGYSDLFDFNWEGTGAGTILVRPFVGDDTFAGGELGNNIANLTGCYDIGNAIEFIRQEGADCDNSGGGGDPDTGETCTVEAGGIILSGPSSICLSDDIPDELPISSVGSTGTNYDYVTTDLDTVITAINTGETIDFSSYTPGNYKIWGIAYEDALTGVALGMKATNITGCYDLSAALDITIEDTATCGGNSNGGGTTQEICDNGIDDDGDGLIDCMDDDCCSVATCQEMLGSPCYIEPTQCEDFLAPDLLIEQLTGMTCEGMQEVCIELPFIEIIDYTAFLDGAPYTDLISACDFDTLITYNLRLVSFDGPYQVNTWTVNGNVFDGTFSTFDELVTLMNTWDAGGNWTLEDNAISGGISSNTYGSIEIQNMVAQPSLVVLGETQQLTPNGTLFNMTIGTHELVLQQQSGCRDTIMVSVECETEPMTTDTINTAIILEQLDTICIASELGIDVATYTAVCTEIPECEIVFTEVVDNCIVLEGVDVGEETVMVTACNADNSICDTTYIVVTVDLPADNQDQVPQANIDSDSTTANVAIVVNILGNDVIPGNELTSTSIVVLPVNGNAMVNGDGTVTYTPDTDYCGLDAFTYRICNDAGCDEASVNIFVQCADMEPQTGFSPNGDGVNETFVIEGIDMFPNNKLSIYDRWGNIVFEQKQYKNEWDGTWDSQDLPDGTYYYLFTYDGGNMTGFVQIHR